jgi:5-formyltetrahydrofolate cyclo-ligase
MVAKLAEVKQERNIALLKVIEKEAAIRRLSEQLQSECRVLVPVFSASVNPP